MHHLQVIHSSRFTKNSNSQLTPSRIRRVKCDETRPVCERCVQAGRTCDGYASATTSHQSRRALACAVRQLQVAGPASRVLGDPMPADDVACFDFFRHCTSSMTASVLPAPFWERQVLQMAHAEKAVWNVVVTLGALHRRWEHSNSNSNSRIATALPTSHQNQPPDAILRFTHQATTHYYGAISLAKAIHDPVTLAVLSAALAAAAHLAGRWAECQVHLHAGLRLLQSHRHHPTALGGLAQSLERLELQAMFFQDARAPYVPFDLSPSSAWLGHIAEPASLHDAATVVFRLMRQFLLISNAAARGMLTLEGLDAAVAQLRQDAQRWEVALEALLPEGDPSHLTVLVLRLYHVMLQQLLAKGVIGPETRYDRCVGLFVEGVELAEQILARSTPSAMRFFMSLELGVVVPLFLTVLRCRHPVVRRRALNMLGRMNRQEGIWNCEAAGRVAEQCIMLEEEGLGIQLPLRNGDGDAELRGLMAGIGEGPGIGDGEGFVPVWPGGWPSVPEEKRVLQTSVVVDVDARVIEMTMHLTGGHGLGTPTRSVSIDI